MIEPIRIRFIGDAIEIASGAFLGHQPGYIKNIGEGGLFEVNGERYRGITAALCAAMVSKGRGTARTLSDAQVDDIVRRKTAGETQTAIAADLGVSQALVSLELKRARS